MVDAVRDRGRVLPTRVAWVGFLTALLAILLVTLAPVGAENIMEGDFFCLWCGDAPLANLLRNVVLFVPLGFFAFGLRPALGVVVLTGLVLTGSIELLQAAIPGRNPLFMDVVANTSGAALGGLLAATVPAWLRPPGPARRRLFAAALTGAALLAATPAWLLVPAPAEESLRAQRNPSLGKAGPYENPILDARLGDASLPPGPPPPGLDVPGAFLAGEPITLTFQVARPVHDRRGLFRILSAVDGAPVTAVSIEGTDLLTSVGYRADRLGLARPLFRAPRLLDDAAPGDTVTLAVALRDDGGLRVHAGPARWEAAGVDQSMAWSLLYFPAGLGPPGIAGLGFLWCGILFLIPAFLAPGRVVAAAAGGGLLLLMVAIPALIPFLAPLPAAGWAGALTGWAVGRLGRAAVDRSGSRPAGTAAAPTPGPPAAHGPSGPP